MKVMVVSHSCVVDVNQQVYVEMARLPEVTGVSLIIPALWKSEYTGQAMTPKLLADATFPVYPLPIRVPGHITLYHFTGGIGKALATEKPDIVLIDEEPWALSTFQVASACRRAGIPFTCYTKQNLYKTYPPPFSWIERWVYNHLAGMLVISEEVEQVLRRKGYQGTCYELPHACDLRMFAPRTSDALREKLGLSGIVVGYIGRLTPEKSVHTLLEALDLLRTAYPEGFSRVTGLIVGTGVEDSALKARAAALDLSDRVVFTGVVPHSEAAQYVAAMDIMVLPSRTTPSWKEQFGRVIIEALACEVPVIGSDSGQIPFVIRDTGGGIVFPEGDSRKVAEALERLLRHPAERQQLGQTGARAVRERYTVEAVGRQIHSLLAQMLPSAPRPAVVQTGGRAA